MGISLKTHKMLWGRSANMCSFPDCKKILVIEETQTDDPSVIGEEAHIVAKSPDGPRGNHQLPTERRDNFDNLILLCAEHHKVIDDQWQTYSVETLQTYKANHLKYVIDNLHLDRIKVRDDERYASYIEKFIELTDLHNWINWTSWIFGASDMFPKAQYDMLKEVPQYVMSRIWPKRYECLEMSMFNFTRVLNDLINVFEEHKEEPKKGATGLHTAKFYKRYYRDECEYAGRLYSREEEQLALNKYNYHKELILDLVVELTRAANYICDQIRAYVFEGFRIEEGVLMLMSADFFRTKTYRVEYRDAERALMPYTDLRAFMEVRSNRDLNFGEGIDEDYFVKMPWE